MAIGGVVINFAAKTTEAVRDVTKLDKALGKVGDGAKNSGSRIGKLAGSLSNSLPIVGAVIGGVVALGGAMIDSANAAMEDKKQSENLANTLSKIPGVTKEAIDANSDWIDSMELASLVSDTDLRAAVGRLALATGDLEEAQKLAALATDVAAGSGKDYSAITVAMAKAADGNTAALSRMFPWLDKNHDGTVTLAEATEELGDKYAGAAGKAAKNSPWKQLKVIWDQLYEAVGQALLPIIEELGEWFANPQNRAQISKFIGKVDELARSVGDDLVEQFKDLVRWLKDPANQKKLEAWGQAMHDLAGQIAGVVRGIQAMIGWLGKIPKLPDWMTRDQGGGGWGFGAQGNAAPTAATRAAPTTQSTAPVPAAPTVIVTEEQIYRAVQRIILRGDARNGRVVLVG